MILISFVLNVTELPDLTVLNKRWHNVEQWEKFLLADPDPAPYQSYANL